jgi:hypothetical protein
VRELSVESARAAIKTEHPQRNINECVALRGGYKRYGDCERSRVSRKLSDFALTVVTLLVLFGGLVSIHPGLRQQTVQMLSEPGMNSLRYAVTSVVVTGFSFVGDYADYHAYLFSFLVAAVVFAVLMIRIIS